MGNTNPNHAPSWLGTLFERLDRVITAACDREERRANLLANGGGRGWDGVRGMLEATLTTLLEPPDTTTTLHIVETPEGPLARLANAFRLSPLELDVLLVLLAPHVEPRYRVLYGVLGDAAEQPWVTERVLLSLLGATRDARRVLLQTIAENGRLRESGLVNVTRGQPPLAATLDLATDVRHVLLELGAPTSVEGAALEWHAGEQSPMVGQLLVVHGDGSRHEALARATTPVRLVIGKALSDDTRLQGIANTLWRIGASYGALPALDLDFVEQHIALPLIETLARKVSTHGGAMAFLVPNGVALPLPHHEARRLDFSERKAVWQEQARLRGVQLDEAAAARLAAAYHFQRAQVADVFAGARAIEPHALAEQAVHLSSTRVPYGRSVRSRRGFDDIVLADTTRAALERLVYFVHNRDRVSELRGLEHRFSLQRGPIVLFAGRSGTGKTLAAEVIAGQLGRSLVVVDLARLVSKYVGETEKNIDAVLSAGERAGAVLFFDEADSLFSQRTEVANSNDRFANLEVGYLLQRIETHDGLVILATNLRQSIDEAFLRRFHARVEFPLPGPRERQRIWELMLPPGVPRTEDLELATLGREHELSGGDIRNAALKAIFLAEEVGGPVNREVLERGVALEMLELGRLSRYQTGLARDAGTRLRLFTHALQRTTEAHLRDVFLKEIHLVHGAPTKENLAGKQPAVSLALFRLAQPRSGGLRLGFVVSAWSSRAEEEHELLGVLHDLLRGAKFDDKSERRATLKVAESHDFDLLHRFWSSHGHPVRASIVVDVELEG